MNNVFSAVIDAVSVSAAQDLLTITAPASRAVKILRVEVGQDTSETSEVLPIKFKRGIGNTAGSGGSAVTPARLKPGSTAASSTVTKNNTTAATAGSGSLTVTNRRSFNVVTGFVYVPMDAEAVVVGPSESFIINLPTAPGAALTMNCEVIFEEMP